MDLVDILLSPFAGLGTVGLAIALVVGMAFAVLGFVGLFVRRERVAKWHLSRLLGAWAFGLFLALGCFGIIGAVRFLFLPS